MLVNLPNDLIRLILLRVTPKTFYAMAYLNKMLSKICLESRFYEMMRHHLLILEVDETPMFITERRISPNNFFNGVSWSFWRNGICRHRTYWRDYKIEGLDEGWWPNGKPSSIVFYRNNFPLGVETLYHETGEIWFHRYWAENGICTGSAIVTALR